VTIKLFPAPRASAATPRRCNCTNDPDSPGRHCTPAGSTRGRSANWCPGNWTRTPNSVTASAATAWSRA